MTSYELWTLVLQGLTVGGVIFAGIQVYDAQKGYQEAREQAFYTAYRQSLSSIPAKYFLGSPLESVFEGLAIDVQQAFFVYIDLCNEQVFAIRNKKIRESTNGEWMESISSNFRLPAFISAF